MILGKLKKLVTNSDRIFELFLLIVMAAVCILWGVEEKLEVIFDYDRYGYIVTLIILPACFCLSFCTKRTAIARVVVFIYLALYLLFLTVSTVFLSSNTSACAKNSKTNIKQ